MENFGQRSQCMALSRPDAEHGGGHGLGSSREPPTMVPSIFADLPNQLILSIIKRGYSDGVRDYWNRGIPVEHLVMIKSMEYQIYLYANQIRSGRRLPKRNEWLCYDCSAICWNHRTYCFRCGMDHPDLQTSESESEEEERTCPWTPNSP